MRSGLTPKSTQTPVHQRNQRRAATRPPAQLKVAPPRDRCQAPALPSPALSNLNWVEQGISGQGGCRLRVMPGSQPCGRRNELFCAVHKSRDFGEFLRKIFLPEKGRELLLPPLVLCPQTALSRRAAGPGHLAPCPPARAGDAGALGPRDAITPPAEEGVG